ncbi:hypothetical protein P153DRAFT_432727 [Dothidotthia symphoricarpi CBS 119687]|uniref:Atos-like conserved domain-containing protein n=1 Tax=Dothidotthia symphoricarpi CBS 119687 TaxID=1392245 RepID=A0A6A6A6L7_9PLEO|nr:uncharacterized protein P153DRAFT_432727 [Dothidotthia symphoricarpi CBS 119687]KAF2127632.1 hypothetical protein P153DRAFT_432727 [Dothidotthia symphoricarpi CBS 119687]
MPVFHDFGDSPPRRSSSRQPTLAALQGEGTSNFGFDTSLLEGVCARDFADSNVRLETSPDTSNHESKPSLLDRMELIEKLKRVNSPPWQQRQSNGGRHDINSELRPAYQGRPKTPLSPSAELKPSRTSTPEALRDHSSVGLAIERPRSALHSGDFREKKADAGSDDEPSLTNFLATSPIVPWKRSFPAVTNLSYRNNASYPIRDVPSCEFTVSRARATSQSSSSPFVFMPPTSPLVQQSNNTDLDFSSRPVSRDGSRSPERHIRPQTISPASFNEFLSTQMATSASGTPAARHLRHGGSIPYQAHQPRRSMTAVNQFQPQSNPQTPFLSSRRPSFSSEASPLHHAPMVGSYEESILRGRMSTTPSRPLNFVAKIGVLGKGQCKSSLKCPPHVTVPFPAVFYSYNTGNGIISDNEPSPYVGLVDLENSLSAPEENKEASKRKRRQTVPIPEQDDHEFRLDHQDQQPDRTTKEHIRRREKKKRRSTSPKAPQGGCYRIPPQGQLQIVLKNPNKTAVKLFLVPYDVSDMEPGQKTFIRQRSYSAGPIIDMPISSRKNLGTDRPEAALSNSDDPNDRPILRYLIHLHICSPSKGRHYLYKSIRVVFANRVPDGKEKLRNEIQLPEPRYSTYKPTRDSVAPQTLSVGGQSTAEKVLRRQSAGWHLEKPPQSYDRIDGLRQHPPNPPPAVQFTGGPLSSSASATLSSPVPLYQPIPFSLTRLAAIESRPVSRECMDIEESSPFRTPLTSPKSGLGSPNSQQEGTFGKLSKGDVGYGGNAFSPLGSPCSPPAAGLLTQILRGLESQQVEEDESTFAGHT